MANIKKHNLSFLGFIENAYVLVLLIIFGGIVLHAPISVGLGTLWPDYSLLIKSWKEILMLPAGFMAIYLLYKKGRVKILCDPLIIAIAVYGLLHVILLNYLSQGLISSLAGLAIDLRYIFFFGLVYVAMRLFPDKRKMFISVGIAGALIVFIFALLQVFVLPYDVLKYIGYNTNTISPYLTIDKNYDFIRINSTMRGPNPLGAYSAIALALITAAFVKGKIKKERRYIAITIILLLGGLVALWASYSRSAFIGAVIALILILIITYRRKLVAKSWIKISFSIAILAGVLLMTINTQFVSNVFFHINPNGGSALSSNQAHVDSLNDSFDQLYHQPLGDGIGSTGSASIFGDEPEIIENQYLFIAHEVGWFGLFLFMYIYISILIRSWELRSDWLALGVFASGISLALIGMILPLWVDDPVSIIWWGLAAIALGSRRYIIDNRLKKSDG